MPKPDSTMTKIDNVPLAERARGLILQAILDKRFDERLPSEEMLAEMLNVSRTTIRTALQGLEQDGIITRKRAVGTTINEHVRPASLALHRLVGFDGLLREKGHKVEIEVDWRRAPAGSTGVEGLAIDGDQDSLIAEKSYVADGSLAIYIRDIVPWVNLRDPDFHGDVPASIFEFSARDWRERVDHALAEIVPMVRKGPRTTKLAVGKAPFTRLHERHYSARGELLAVSIIDVDNRFFYFEVFRRR